MTDIKRIRELLAIDPRKPWDIIAKAHEEIFANLPALLDELERLRAEIAFRDAPNEPLSAGEIDSIVKRVLAEESK